MPRPRKFARELSGKSPESKTDGSAVPVEVYWSASVLQEARPGSPTPQSKFNAPVAAIEVISPTSILQKHLHSGYSPHDEGSKAFIQAANICHVQKGLTTTPSQRPFS